MNCSEAERLFDAYLDRELNGSLRFEFDTHRLHCPVCQRKLAMMEACEHILVGDQRGPAVSSDFTERVMAQVAVRSERQRRSRYLKLFVGGAVGLQAAAAVMFFFIWTYGQDRNVQPVHRDPQKVVLLDPDEKMQAMQDGSGAELIDLMFRVVKQAQSDGEALPKYAASLAIPRGAPSGWNWLGVFFGDAADDETEKPATPGAANDPFEL